MQRAFHTQTSTKLGGYLPNQKSKFFAMWPKWPFCFYEKDKLTPNLQKFINLQKFLKPQKFFNPQKFKELQVGCFMRMAKKFLSPY